MFRTVPLSIIRSFSLYIQQCYMSYRFVDSLRAGSGRFRPDHVELYSKNEFEQLVHLVGFIIRIFHDAWSPERQIRHEFMTRYTLTAEQYHTIGLDTRFKIDI